MQTARLQAALASRFFPYVESLGFVRDKRQEPRIVCFRRRAGTVVQIFAVLHLPRGRPGFWIQFAESPVTGIDYGGSHLSPEEIFPGNFSLLHGWLVPKRGQRGFRLSSPLRRLISWRRDDAEVLIQRLLELFPEVLAWWESKAKGAHLIVLPPKPPRPIPSHAPVFGEPVKPSLFQRFFALDDVWPIQLFGLAVIVDLSFAVQAPDLKQMFGMILPGAAIGFFASWFVFKLLWHIRIWINGGPFKEGDIVQVIGGPHAGKIAAVYEEWPSRSQVRVDLGEAEWKNVKDVFYNVQLVKVKKAPAPVEVGALQLGLGS